MVGVVDNADHVTLAVALVGVAVSGGARNHGPSGEVHAAGDASGVCGGALPGDAGLTGGAHNAAGATVLKVGLQVSASAAAQCLPGGTTGAAGSAETALALGTGRSAGAAVGRIGGRYGADAPARCAEAGIGVARGLHLIFNEQIGICPCV
jgi:hypothetical protein